MGGSKSAKGGPNPLVDMDRGGPNPQGILAGPEELVCRNFG